MLARSRAGEELMRVYWSLTVRLLLGVGVWCAPLKFRDVSHGRPDVHWQNLDKGVPGEINHPGY